MIKGEQMAVRRRMREKTPAIAAAGVEPMPVSEAVRKRPAEVPIERLEQQEERPEQQVEQGVPTEEEESGLESTSSRRRPRRRESRSSLSWTKALIVHQNIGLRRVT